MSNMKEKLTSIPEDLKALKKERSKLEIENHEIIKNEILIEDLAENLSLNSWKHGKQIDGI